MCKHHTRHLPKSVTRRDILRFSVAGMGLAALGPLGRGIGSAVAGVPTTSTKSVFLNLVGGNDGLNTVIPLSLPNYYSLRPNIKIPAGSELSLDVGPHATTLYGFHPAMVNLRNLWQAGQVALVNRVGYFDPNLSHFTSGDIYSYGVRNDFASLSIPTSGWIARYADHYAPTAMGAVAVGAGRPLDFVGGTTSSFLASSLSSFQYSPDAVWPENHTHRIQAIKDVLAGFQGAGIASEIRDALDQGHALSGQIQAAVASYVPGPGVVYPVPPSYPGPFFKDVATIIQGGFDTRLFYVQFGGFDTHADQGAATGQQATLLSRMDAAIGAFALDMQAMGIWDKMVIVVHSEFGRRNYENGSGGCDHGHGNVFLVIGGGITGGVYGPDLTTTDLAGEYPDYAVDFRDVYRDVVANHLGADPTPVFPESQPLTYPLAIT